MRSLHGTYSVWKLFIYRLRPHLERIPDRMEPAMTNLSLTRVVSVAAMGILAAVALALILAPQPSLYAG